MVEMKDPQKITMKNGKPATQAPVLPVRESDPHRSLAVLLGSRRPPQKVPRALPSGTTGRTAQPSAPEDDEASHLRPVRSRRPYGRPSPWARIRL